MGYGLFLLDVNKRLYYVLLREKRQSLQPNRLKFIISSHGFPHSTPKLSQKGYLM